MFRYFERLVEPFPADGPQTPPAGLFAFCWHHSKPVAPFVALMALFSALIGVGEAMLFAFLGSIVDWLTERDRATFLAEEGWTLATMGVFVVVVLPGIVLLQNFVVHQGLLGNYPMLIRWQSHRHLLGHSLAFFAEEFAGRVATKVMQTSLAVRESVMKLFDILVYVVSFFIAMVFVAASADWRLMIPMLVWLVVYVTLLCVLVPRLGRVAQLQADARAVMTGRIVDSYTNISLVKLFSHAHREESYAREGMDAFLETVYWQMRLASVLSATLYWANSLLAFAVAAMAIAFWLEAAISLGAIAVSVGLALRLNGMSYWIMFELSTLFENIGTVEDGQRLLARRHGVVDRPAAGTLAVPEGRVAFESIRFHYGKHGGLIEDLSLTIQPGQKLGLVGRSGAGKSTLLNLLLRLHDLEGGVIRVDGQDVSAVSQESLRAQIGVVTQDTSLLHRSIRENIAYGRPDATEAEIVEAARRARADEFIADLVDAQGHVAYEAQVGERGVKLSGGQRQRIAIARVFLKDAPILLLDEATSALDSEVEAAIQDSLYDLMRGKTVIVIAHRLSTIAALDRLVVMDQGSIVEDGSHEQLLALGGLYARLWQRQSGGFLDDGLRDQAAA